MALDLPIENLGGRKEKIFKKTHALYSFGLIVWTKVITSKKISQILVFICLENLYAIFLTYPNTIFAMVLTIFFPVSTSMQIRKLLFGQVVA